MKITKEAKYGIRNDTGSNLSYISNEYLLIDKPPFLMVGSHNTTLIFFSIFEYFGYSIFEYFGYNSFSCYFFMTMKLSYSINKIEIICNLRITCITLHSTILPKTWQICYKRSQDIEQGLGYFHLLISLWNKTYHHFQ